MKTHLPLSLLRALQKSLRPLTHTTLGSGALALGSVFWLVSGTLPLHAGSDEFCCPHTQPGSPEPTANASTDAITLTKRDNHRYTQSNLEGNSLKLAGFEGSVRGISNFRTLHFFLKSWEKDATLLKLTGGDSTLRNLNIHLDLASWDTDTTGQMTLISGLKEVSLAGWSFTVNGSPVGAVYSPFTVKPVQNASGSWDVVAVATRSASEQQNRLADSQRQYDALRKEREFQEMCFGIATSLEDGEENPFGLTLQNGYQPLTSLAPLPPVLRPLANHGHLYLSKKPVRQTAAAQTTEDEEDEEKGEKEELALDEQQEEQELQLATVEEPGTAPASPGGQGGKARVLMRRMSVPTAAVMAMDVEADEELTSQESTPDITLPENSLIWVGDGNWSTDADDWQTLSGSSATTTPGTANTAVFDDAASIKNVNVSTNKTLGGMVVTGSGYTFSGGGRLSMSGGDFIAAMEAGSSTQQNTLTLGTSNHLTAGNVVLSSAANTLTTFNSSITADTLTISNDGQYHLNTATIAGAASITLNATSAQELLTVTGDFSAGSLTLNGAALKRFESAVTTTSGGLTIGAHAGELGVFNGDTTFLGNVLIAKGGVLEINNNAKATFSGTVASASGTGQLETVLNQGLMVVNTFLSSMSSGVAYDLGTITLEGLGILELSTRSVVAFDLADNGHKFILNGSARRADITLVADNRSGDKLANGSDLTLNGGNVNLYSGGGQVGGTLTVDGSSTSVNLMSDYLFADDATGISVVEGKLNLGSTTQSIPGAIDLQKGGTISGGTLVVPEAALNTNKTGAITYTGANNAITGTAMNSNGFTLTVQGQGEGSSLTLTGGTTLTGTGSLLFTGSGTTTIDTELKYSGAVTVNGGSTVELVNNKALYDASSVTVGGGGNLAITHNGEHSQLNGTLTLTKDATLTFNNLASHEGHTEGALAITNGSLLFNTTENDNVTIAFNEELKNFTTYTLVTSDTSINFTSGDATQKPGTVTILMDGTAVTGGQYEFSFSKGDDGTRYLYFTTMLGNQWKGVPTTDTSGNPIVMNWHDAATPTSSNWTLGQAGYQTNDLFRELTNTDGTLVSKVAIRLDSTPQAKKLFMDGRTNYTFIGEGTTGFLRGMELVKRGAASNSTLLGDGQGILELDNVQSYDSAQDGVTDSALGDIKIDGGEIHLTNGTKIGVTEDSTIHVALNETVAGVEMFGKLLVDSTSYLLLSGLDELGNAVAYVQGIDKTNKAELAGLDVNGTTISGLGSAAESYIKNAAIAGATLEGLALTGTGSLSNTTLSGSTQFGPDSVYDLSGSITVSSTITNAGTLNFNADDLVLNIGNVTSTTTTDTSGQTSTTYSLFSGSGKYNVYGTSTTSGLTASNFTLYGTNLSGINNVGFKNNHDGSITVSADGVTFIDWDPEWDSRMDAGTIKPIIAINVTSNESGVIYLVGGKGSYAYSQRLNEEGQIEGADKVYTINLAKGSGAANTTIYALTGTVSSDSEVWINSDCSDYEQIYAGYRRNYDTGTSAGPEFNGNVHVQLSGAHSNLKEIITGSYRAKQIGDTFLTINNNSTDEKGELPIADFSNATVVAGNSTYGTDSPDDAVHYGDSFLHITGGKFGTVYGGSYQTYTGGSHSVNVNVGNSVETVTEIISGDTSVLIDGGTIATIHGGDFTTTRTDMYGNVTVAETTHLGNVNVELKGGTVTRVYAAGGYDTMNVYTTLNNTNKVDGNASISLYADANGKMLTTFAPYSIETEDDGESSSLELSVLLYGGEDVVSGSSTLNFANAGNYYLNGSEGLYAVTLERFDHFTLATGAHASVRADLFNTTNALTISGAGVVEVTADSGNRNTVVHDVTLKDGATLHLNTSYYQSTSATPTASTITATAGTTIDASYTGFVEGGTKQNAMNVALFLAGTGVNQQGALYKGSGGSLEEGISFPAITLTNHATMNLATGTDFYMVAAATNGESSTAFSQTTLDLRDGGNSERGYVLTLTGGGTLGLYYTAITGGTLDVTGKSTVESNLNSAAGDTDLVLRNGTTLLLTHKTYTEGDLTGSYGYETNGNPASYNGFAVESLSGSGSINLSNHGWLYINMTKSHGGFDTTLDTTGLAGYAYYSGTISDSGAGRVSLAGTDDAEEHFTGSESTYRGGTSVLGGTLYLDGSSTARQFSKGVSVVEKGVIGSATTSTDSDTGEVMLTDNGTLTWQGGTVYLGDGVNIFNDGIAATQTVTEGTLPYTIKLGVDSHAVMEGTKTSTTYDVATWSGVLRNPTDETVAPGTLEKLGGGTLILTQDGTFTGDVAVKEGSLNLRHWVDAGDYSSIAVSRGASLVFTYDNTGVDDAGQVNEITSFNTPITIAGTGDTRWETLGENTRTAALSSGIAAGKTLEIAGIIQDETSTSGTRVETISGNLLHSGSGTLILSGANTYSGGTTVDGGGLYANGTVIVKHSTGLGATADGGTATLTTAADTRIEFVNNVDEYGTTQHMTETILAAAGNDIRGTVAVGEKATLVMANDGYYARRTELEEGSTLVFYTSAASNWQQGIAANATADENGGAGVLAGCGTVMVQGEGSTVYFQVTDSLHEGEKGFAGDMVVEGENALLHIQGGELDGGNIAVSGEKATLSAARSEVYVEDTKRISLVSEGSTEEGTEARLIAHHADIKQGGILSVSGSATAMGAEAASAAANYALNTAALQEDTTFTAEEALGTPNQVQTKDGYYYAPNYSGGYDLAYSSAHAQNTTAHAVVETEDGLTLAGDSTYDFSGGSNTSLVGGALTFNVTEDAKIILSGGAAFEEYLSAHAQQATVEGSEPNQWVLFSEVGSFTAIMDSLTLASGSAIDADAEQNQLYVVRASDVFSHANLTDYTVLVYDAKEQVVYLDHATQNRSIPEPATATLALAALAALAARRRRQCR